jgi:hypothetical protein
MVPPFFMFKKSSIENISLQLTDLSGSALSMEKVIIKEAIV